MSIILGGGGPSMNRLLRYARFKIWSYLLLLGRELIFQVEVLVLFIFEFET